MVNPFTASRFLSVLPADQVTVIGNEINSNRFANVWYLTAKLFNFHLLGIVSLT